MRHNTQKIYAALLLSLFLLSICATAGAQSFSHHLSFQGRLVDVGTGKPLPDGQYQVTFTIYDAEADGNALWTETQTVDQVGGVFSVYLGSVTPFPGDLFAYGDRWLALQVSGDPEMTERFRFTPSPWALYSASSGPDDDWSFSGADIYRAAGNVGIGTNSPSYPLHVFGDGSRAAYIDHNGASGCALMADSTRTAVLAQGGDCGLDAYAYSPTGYAVYAFNEAESGSAYAFYGENTSPDGIAIYGLADNGSQYSTGIGVYGRSDGDYAGTGVYGEATNTGTTYGVRGVSAHGIGVRGEQTDSGNYGMLGTSNCGVEGFGTGGGIKGQSTAGTGVVGQSTSGTGVYGEASGANSKGVEGFTDIGVAVSGYSEDVGTGVEGYSDSGIGVHGEHGGGNYGNLGTAKYGVEGCGTAGGYFQDENDFSYAYAADGQRGINAGGNLMGGRFEDTDTSSYAKVGNNVYGIYGDGSEIGGYFRNQTGSGYAAIGALDLGIGACGNDYGGWFSDWDGKGYAFVGKDNRGIEAFGSDMGGYFETTDGSGYAYAGHSDSGIKAFGAASGGVFEDSDDGTFALVASRDTKISGNGAVAFVQNHPEEPDKVIVYACPEGDEVATYTRGTARLVDGKAVVPLGETFKWVTNPDIGLTAHLTPRGEWADLYVVSLTTEELVVASRDPSSSGAFDYLVYGLRIGFEEVAIVREKEREAYIPSMADHRALYERRPELRDLNALERFKRMRAAAGEAGDVDLTASQELHDRIVEFDPAIHGIDVPVE